MATRKNARFTDQPQMTATRPDYGDDYWAGSDDAAAANPRCDDERGTAQYHKGYDDKLGEMKSTKK